MNTKAKKKVLMVKNGSNRSGVGKWVKAQIMEHYNNETELDTVALATAAREKFGSKTNQKCVQWYIHDLRKSGEIE